MAQEQNYQVNYSINVEATKGTQQVQAFAEAVGNLVKAKVDLTPAITNINKMMDESESPPFLNNLPPTSMLTVKMKFV